MARIRTLKPEFPQSESMGNVSRDARLTFIELWTIADDEGRLRGNSRMLASLLFPYDDDAPALIDGWLGELEREGCIDRYKVEGQSYLQIRNWLIHQKIDKPSRSKIPPFDESSRIISTSREPSSEDQGPRIKDQGEENPLGASAPGETADQQGDAKGKAEKPVDEEFEHAWSLYPKRYGGNPKNDALKCWNARKREGVKPEDMIVGVERYAAYLQASGKVGTEFVMQAQRFFGPSRPFAEAWPITGAERRSVPRQDQKFTGLNDIDHSSSRAAQARSIQRMGIQVDDNPTGQVDF